ncbi:GntR family transcriptional regulator [Naasia sp. SYSU D00948]|uniref:GntR family transcriptional regulator n=1 Tax=Naasia sp. SYSU D00948 TaxID=2817379 RepID=UPI001B304D72|nr:GntR family transcriptional regulator [Naasia sp. SYSU D00948]
MDLDRSGPVPLYFQLASRLETAILEGELPPGSRIENELALSGRLGLSRPTVRRAIQELVDKGLIVRRRGIGTQVVQGRSTRKMGLTGLYDDLSQDDKHPSTKPLLHEVVPAGEKTSAQLGIPVGEPVLHLRRLRFSDGAPVALMENFLPPEFATITAEQLVQHGLYQLMRSQGATMKVARQTIGARHPSPEERRLLQISRPDPVLTMDRVAYDHSGRAIDLGHHAYRPDLYNIEVTVVDR